MLLCLGPVGMCSLWAHPRGPDRLLPCAQLSCLSAPVSKSFSLPVLPAARVIALPSALLVPHASPWGCTATLPSWPATPARPQAPQPRRLTARHCPSSVIPSPLLCVLLSPPLSHPPTHPPSPLLHLSPPTHHLPCTLQTATFCFLRVSPEPLPSLRRCATRAPREPSLTCPPSLPSRPTHPAARPPQQHGWVDAATGQLAAGAGGAAGQSVARQRGSAPSQRGGVSAVVAVGAGVGG